MRVKKMSATTALVATMSCGQAMLPASAVTVPEEVSVPSPVQEDVDLQALEAEVTTIFERYLQQDSEGRWSVNVEAVGRTGRLRLNCSVSRKGSMSDRTYVFPGSEDKEAGGKGASPQHQFGSWEWGKCVLNIAVPGAGTMLIDGAIRGLLARAKYAQVASWLLRVVGRSASSGWRNRLGGFACRGSSWCSTSVAS